MKKNIKSFLFVSLAISLLATSCIKDDAPGAGSAGTPKIKILEGPKRALFFSPFLTVKNIDLFSVRRDEVSAAGIDQSITIKVMAQPDSVETYNDANGTSYEALPDSLYTIVGNGVTRNGEVFSIPIPAQAIGNELTIAMNGGKWDVTHKYAMMFTIVDPAGLAITNGLKSVFVTIEAKNQWDGVYEVTGSYTDLTNAAFKGVYPYTWELQTLSPTQCVVYDNELLGGVGFVFSTTGDPADLSYYGSFGLVVTFDPATNKIVDLQNYYGQPSGNTRSAHLDPSGENMYNADSKTISIKYYMTQPSVVPTPPNIRATWDEKWKYTGPRG